MRKVALLCVAAVALGGATFAFASSLGVTAATLTGWTGGGGIAVSGCTLGAVADSYVNAQSTGTNYGTATVLTVENGNKAKRALVRFDVASCVPGNARIVTAQLSLYLAQAPTVPKTYEVYRLTGTWTEAAVTWANQPGAAATPTGALATGTTNGITLAYDVLADVQAFADGTANEGWHVMDQNEGSNPGREGSFSSREAGSNTPSLSITFYP